jgi:hypothetical protein
MSNEFDWGSLGESWWTDASTSIGADLRQAKFACCVHRGCSNTEAARQAGYSPGNEEGMRAEGYRVSRSNKVLSLLALANAETGTGPDGTVDKAEAKRILSSLARGSDPAVRIRAIEQLQRMEEQERASAAEEGPIDPIKSVAELCETSPLFAAFIIANNNVRPAPDFILKSFPSAALAAMRGSAFTVSWSRAFVEEIAAKLGIKLDEAQATKDQPQVGNGDVAAYQ